MSRRCVETNVGPSMLTSNRDLYMGRCDHRNPYQVKKIQCVVFQKRECIVHF